MALTLWERRLQRRGVASRVLSEVSDRLEGVGPVVATASSREAFGECVAHFVDTVCVGPLAAPVCVVCALEPGLASLELETRLRLRRSRARVRVACGDEAEDVRGERFFRDRFRDTFRSADEAVALALERDLGAVQGAARGAAGDEPRVVVASPGWLRRAVFARESTVFGSGDELRRLAVAFDADVLARSAAARDAASALVAANGTRPLLALFDARRPRRSFRLFFLLPFRRERSSKSKPPRSS